MDKKYILIGFVVILVLAVFFVKSFTGNSIKENENIKEFEVNAFRFGYSPDSVTVNLGDKVRIKINNTDTLHGIRIPELGIKGNEVVEFSANKTGEFTWYCTNYCGTKDEHMSMQGKLIVK